MCEERGPDIEKADNTSLPGSVFKTIYFRCNLPMGPVS